MLATTTWNDVAMVLTIGTFVMVWVLVMIKVSVKLRRQSQAPPVIPNPAHQPAAVHWADDSLSVVSRITQQFCPRCRAPLAVDAPEGLCPACLMAGGLASAAAVEPASGFAVTAPPSGSKPPTQGEWSNLAERFPQLELLELLGRGGMGAVYKARQKNLDRIVALKVIPPEAAKDPTFAERFQREARAMARLNHANIVTVYDFGEVGDLYYLLMEYVDGVNLRHALRASRLAPTEALAIVPQICDALQYAHDQGVVHRDIKPENILLDRLGRVKIADFGLAKMLGKGPDNFTLTATQQVMGTPRYMAPEQVERPSSVDHRADIYSLGVVFYEMLTGELPMGRFEPPSHKVQVDVRIDHVVLRTLEKEPERRYQQASQLKTELASAAPPTWHTPMPAMKQTAALGEAPLGRTLAVAIGMVLGVIVATAGLVAAVYGFANFPILSGPWWGCMGAAFGFVGGGFGSFAGSYNTYRQMGGAVDLMKSPETTWFDWTIRGYFVFGLMLLAAGVVVLLSQGPRDFWQPVLIIGAITAVQGALFLVYRVLLAGPAAVSSPRQRRDLAGGGTRVSVLVVAGAAALLIMLVCFGTLAALLIPAIQAARGSARRMQSMNNLKQIGIALHNYHDAFGSFPPAVVTDADGKPLYSGRVLLLPFFEQEALYRAFDLSQPWDSPRNLAISRTVLPIFMDPAGSGIAGRTDYLFVSGKGTIFEDGRSTQLSDVLDGTSQTLAMVEVRGFGVNWAEPRDLDLSQPAPLPPGNHSTGNLVLFADGSARFLARGALAPSQVRALATRGGYETKVTLP